MLHICLPTSWVIKLRLQVGKSTTKSSSFELLMDPRPVFCQFLIIQNPEQNGDSSGKPSKNRGFVFFAKRIHSDYATKHLSKKKKHSIRPPKKTHAVCRIGWLGNLWREIKPTRT